MASITNGKVSKRENEIRRWCVKWMSQVLLFFTCWTHLKRTYWTENAQCHFYNTFIIYSLSAWWKVVAIANGGGDGGGTSTIWKSQRETSNETNNRNWKKGAERRYWTVTDLIWVCVCVCGILHLHRKASYPQNVQRATFWHHLSAVPCSIFIQV